jgi:hypothetical protein
VKQHGPNDETLQVIVTSIPVVAQNVLVPIHQSRNEDFVIGDQTHLVFVSTVWRRASNSNCITFDRLHVVTHMHMYVNASLGN